MLGAIFGDTVGSRFEWNNIKSKDFDLLHRSCFPTDDSYMTIAVANAILDYTSHTFNLLEELKDTMPGAVEAIDGKVAEAIPDADMRKLAGCAVQSMRSWGRAYPYAGYGGHFRKWLASPEIGFNHSCGNGSAMRVSACGWAGGTLQEAIGMADAVTVVTHGHPEGMKGAEATAACIWLAHNGRSRQEIRDHVNEHYYSLDFTVDKIRPSYAFEGTCQKSVPQAIEAFLEAEDFEDAIRNAISIGGDSDTIAAIAGSIAEAYFGIPDDLRKRVLPFLDERMLKVLTAFEAKYPPVAGAAKM